VSCAGKPASAFTIMIIKDQRSLYMRILVVDDSEDGREVAEAMLLAAGYEAVRIVASAAEAYHFLAIGESATLEPPPIDLVLLDILMPEIDGIEACARIRNEPRYADVPIIMVTSIADKNSLANAFIAGATDYITKPLNRVELLARVRSALRLKSELDRRQARERELVALMSTGGANNASLWIDEATGLFVGEAAEAYLTAAAHFPSDADTSVIALAIDRIDACRSTQGNAMAAQIMAQVAGAVRATAATVGVVAAAYHSGVIVLVVPEFQSKQALELGETLRAAIARLGIANPESLGASHITASVVAVTGQVGRWIDRVDLLTRAISALPRVAAAGGNRVVAEYA
jgi:PleD family two-component response regulator